jgi:uncharacterized Rmd1/YagE family protein
MKLQILAFQVAENINIKKFKIEFAKTVHTATATELYYEFENNKALYILNYGVVVFCGYNDIEKSEFLRFIKNFTENDLETPFQEDFYIIKESKETRFIVRNNGVFFPAKANQDALRVVMLNVAQSVGLDYYETLTDDILQSTQVLVKELEINGKLKITKKELLKFIGKTLNIKNSIADNLYILDSPNIVWDDENLDRLNNSLKQQFDTYPRFKDLDYRLKIIEDNLRLFSDISQHRENRNLEITIIVLISTLLNYPITI